MRDLIDIIKPLLTGAAFKKSNQSWYRATNDVLQIINLQKSQWGNQFYLNFGIYLDEYKVDTKVRSNWCHIHFRLDEEDQEAKALDMDHQMHIDERKKLISSLLLKGLEQLSLLNSKSAIELALKQDKCKSMRVLPSAIKLLKTD